VKRARIQNGSVVYNKRFGTWNFLWFDDGGRRRSRKLGDLSELPTRESAQKKADALRQSLRFENQAASLKVKTLVEQYQIERMPTRYSTSRVYKVWFKKHILPRWGEHPITDLQPRPVELWLSGLELAPKTRGHVRGLMRAIWNYAMWSQAVPVQANPIALVTVKGSSKRRNQPRSLTVDEFQIFLRHLEEPFRTMSLVCVCLGLRISECLGLKWSDVDWLNNKLNVERGIVRQRVGDVKTSHSGRKMSIDEEMLKVLKSWRIRTEFSSESDWIFASPVKLGRQPWSYDQVLRSFRVAAEIAGIERLGTHSMRHTYRSWLDAAGTPIAVQQKLMRHGDIRTTMNVYGDVVTNEMQQAHSMVVQMALQKPN
jgi:integrase